MKPMIAFKLSQNRHCADKSCSANGLGPPQEYLNSIDKCMCNLNIQICNQTTGEDVKDEEEPAAESGTNFWNRPRTPQVIVKQCKFSGASAGISNDDWSAMHQCGVDQNRMAVIKKLSEEQIKQIEKKADDVLNPLKSGNEEIIAVDKPDSPSPSQAETSLTTKRVAIVKGGGQKAEIPEKVDKDKDKDETNKEKTNYPIPDSKIIGLVIAIIIILAIIAFFMRDDTPSAPTH